MSGSSTSGRAQASGAWHGRALRRCPQVTAIDLPQVLPAFEERAESLGLRDRVELVAADYHSMKLPSEAFDRVLLANVLHLEPPHSARSLLRRVTAALAPGGELVVIDALLQGDPARDRARSIYALHLAMRTRQGRVHSRAEVERWCREAGLGEGELVTLSGPPRALGALIHRHPRSGDAVATAEIGKRGAPPWISPWCSWAFGAP